MIYQNRTRLECKYLTARNKKSGVVTIRIEPDWNVNAFKEVLQAQQEGLEQNQIGM